ncbi:hypothetical protein MNEG_11863, partial [Monoraphidium neglectum]
MTQLGFSTAPLADSPAVTPRLQPEPQEQQQPEPAEHGATAFRLAEKHYQLHRDQDIRI